MVVRTSTLGLIAGPRDGHRNSSASASMRQCSISIRARQVRRFADMRLSFANSQRRSAPSAEIFPYIFDSYRPTFI